VAQPGNVRVHAVDGGGEQLDVALLEFGVVAGEFDEFGGSDRREVHGMGKKNHPLSGDFNNDGMPDFAVANNGDDTVSVFLGQRNGLFKALTPISTGASSAPYALAVADFDGDGKLDLAVVLFGANTVAISLVGDWARRHAPQSSTLRGFF